MWALVASCLTLLKSWLEMFHVKAVFQAECKHIKGGLGWVSQESWVQV